MALTDSKKTMIATVECYNAWSNTYDSDGNVLQLLDDDAFEEIAQPLLNSIQQDSAMQICCELGCGTGRNTIKVLAAGWSVVSIKTNKYKSGIYQNYRFLFCKYLSTNIVSFILTMNDIHLLDFLTSFLLIKAEIRAIENYLCNKYRMISL